MLLELTSLAIRFPEIVMAKSKISVIVLGEMVLVCRQVRRIHNDLVTQVKSLRGSHPLLELSKRLRPIILWISRFY